MANKERLAILRQSVSAWNAQRLGYDIEIDLREADLSGADLRRADLSGASLRQAQLSRANLSGQDLRYVNLNYVNLREANLRNANLSRANLWEANLSGADLSGANLSGAQFSRANLSGQDFSHVNLNYVNLREANLRNANLSGQDLSEADLSRANLSGADLSGANLNWQDLRKVNLSGADLRRADLSGANLSGADLRRADLSEQDLNGVNLRGANLSETNLSRANLSGQGFMRADFNRAYSRVAILRRSNLKRAVRLRGSNLSWLNFNRAYLRRANLSGANLSKANLSGQDLRKTNLSGANLKETNLIDVNIDGATLTDACLWETQRAGWSIQGVICEAAYWDRDGKDRTIYNPGEFERLYAEATKIVLHYEGGISPIEIATLPALIQRIEAAHPGCVLRLHAVQDAPRGAIVTLVIDNTGEHNPAEQQEALQELAKQLQAAQRYALEQKEMRQLLEHQLSQIKDTVWPLFLEEKLKGRALQSPPQTYYLTTLFLDMQSFSSLQEDERTKRVNMLRGISQTILEQSAAKYVNTWGDAIVACFDDANIGLACARQLMNALRSVDIHIRIGMSRGETLVKGNPLIGRLDIEGDSINLAARLEPLAEPGEVLIDNDLRYSLEVNQDRFIFTCHQRSLKKAVGNEPQGATIECYSVKLVEES